jgi:thioredoxin 1
MKLIHFTAEWCGPCKMMKPMISQILVERPDLEYQMVDIDAEPDYAKSKGVMGVPTFIVTENGEDVARATGAMPKQKFLESLGI